MMKSRSPIFAAFVLVSAVACGNADKKPAQVPTTEPAPSAAAASTPAPSNVDNEPTKGDLDIDELIRKACGITETEAHFAYDSANVKPEYRKVFKKLAVCFSTGPLKDKTMQLVGHADNRGDDNYNMALGGQRADNVKKVIAAEGLSADRIETSSMGEMQATGTDEASWAKDRRVEVKLKK